MKITDSKGEEIRVGDRVRCSHGMSGPITKTIAWPDRNKGAVGLYIEWEAPFQHEFHWWHAWRRCLRRSIYRCPDLLKLDNDQGREGGDG